MCLIEWSNKDTSIFIELLKERNCLWQIKCKEYKNKVLRGPSAQKNTFLFMLRF